MKLIHSGYMKQTWLVFSRHKIKWWGFLETKPSEELSEEEWVSNLPVEHRGAEVDTGKHWRQKMPWIFVRWVMFRAGCLKFGITDIWGERILCCGVLSYVFYDVQHQPYLCQVDVNTTPPPIYPYCDNSLSNFLTGKTSLKMPANLWVCDSSLISKQPVSIHQIWYDMQDLYQTNNGIPLLSSLLLCF